MHLSLEFRNSDDLPAEIRGRVLVHQRAVDIINVLRSPSEMRFPGFVFAVIELADPETSHHFAGRGVAASPDGRYLLLLHPTHLLGVEAALTAQTTKYLGISSGGTDVRQRVDLLARATHNLKAGEMLAMGGVRRCLTHQSPYRGGPRPHTVAGTCSGT